MKTKTWLKISIFMIIPAIISSFGNIMTAILYSQGKPEAIQHYNHSFAFWIALTCVISMAFMTVTMLHVITYADKIDSLEDEKQKYFDAKLEMEKARDEYTKQLIRK